MLLHCAYQMLYKMSLVTRADMELYRERHLLELAHVDLLFNAVTCLGGHRNSLAAMALVHLDASVGEAESNHLVTKDRLTVGTQHEVTHLDRMLMEETSYTGSCLIGKDVVEP